MNEGMWPLAGVPILLLAMAAAVFWLSRRQRLKSGLPQGRIVYSDMGAWIRCQEPLYAAQYGLTGKPDYLVQVGRHRIPVEVKPSRRAKRPYRSDIFQLVAYCLLVEETSSRPPYGLIRYAEDTFQIPYTHQLRAQLLSLLAEIRCQYRARDVSPNHHYPGRCLACGYRHVCDQRVT